MIIRIQQGEYAINTNHIADIDVSQDEWEITMASDQAYTLPEEDMEKFCKHVNISDYIAEIDTTGNEWEIITSAGNAYTLDGDAVAKLLKYIEIE